MMRFFNCYKFEKKLYKKGKLPCSDIEAVPQKACWRTENNHHHGIIIIVLIILIVDAVVELGSNLNSNGNELKVFSFTISKIINKF